MSKSFGCVTRSGSVNGIHVFNLQLDEETPIGRTYQTRTLAVSGFYESSEAEKWLRDNLKKRIMSDERISISSGGKVEMPALGYADFQTVTFGEDEYRLPKGLVEQIKNEAIASYVGDSE